MKMYKFVGSWILTLMTLAGAAAVDPSRPSCEPGAAVPPTRTDTSDRVSALRDEMTKSGVYALIIPTADEHQNEYVGENDKKRSYISGFTGSAGTALVTLDKQLLWTDGRYFLQAADELDCNWSLMRSGEAGVPSLTGWILDNVLTNQTVGAYSKVISTKSWMYYEEAFGRKGLQIQATGDLVGQVWDNSGNRPLPSNNSVVPLAMEFAGRTWQQKVADLRTKLTSSGAEAIVVSALDEVAWLFNLRGSDIAYNPVFFAYAIVETDSTKSPKLYLREAAGRGANIYSHLNADSSGQCSTSGCVEVLDYSAVDRGVQDFINSRPNSTIWISGSTNYHITSLVSNRKQINSNPSPLLLMKAIKNPVERDGMRKSHIRDSAAIVQFIAMLEKELDQGKAWDEMKVASTIDGLRKVQTNNEGLSFGTIAGSGKNGAYIHYSPSNITNNVVDKTKMLLLDSGGQYLDGTTDITRTFHFGTPTDFQKLAYTLVLLGVIDLALMKFPANKTLGSSLDTLARRPMWEYGLDFGHGTGHGIGMYLNVHEGPARISARRASSSVSDERPIYDGMFFSDGPAGIGPKRASSSVSTEQAIYDGMFFSDEPGYYDDVKEFGVRLETIVMATYVNTKYGAPNTTLEFEPIALVPFEKKLINVDMLDEKHVKWLNNYHKLCLENTGEFLKRAGKQEAYDWLADRTNTIKKSGTTPSDCCGASSLTISSLALALAMLAKLAW